EPHGPAPVSWDGAPSEVARLRHAAPGRRRAMWGAADCVPGGALSGCAPYPAPARHGQQHRPPMASAVRGVGDVSSVAVRRSYRHCLRHIGRGEATRHVVALLYGAITPLSAGGDESGGEPGAADLCHAPARPGAGLVTIR